MGWGSGQAPCIFQIGPKVVVTRIHLDSQLESQQNFHMAFIPRKRVTPPGRPGPVRAHPHSLRRVIPPPKGLRPRPRLASKSFQACLQFYVHNVCSDSALARTFTVLWSLDFNILKLPEVCLFSLTRVSPCLGRPVHRARIIAWYDLQGPRRFIQLKLQGRPKVEQMFSYAKHPR